MGAGCCRKQEVWETRKRANMMFVARAQAGDSQAPTSGIVPTRPKATVCPLDVVPMPIQDPEKLTCEVSERPAVRSTTQTSSCVFPRVLPRISGRNSSREGPSEGYGSEGAHLSVSRMASKDIMRSSISSASSRGLRSDRGNVSLRTGVPFPKMPKNCNLSPAAWQKIEHLFRLMDVDCCNVVTRADALTWFKGAFARLSADAMFASIDEDRSGAITANEFVMYWSHVQKAGYSDSEIQAELDEIIEGNAWMCLSSDSPALDAKAETFPKRPLLCRMSARTWQKCEELFRRMDRGDKMLITREDAEFFFMGAFGNVSANAMFNELDTCQHGNITPKAFMDFWRNVRASGYKEEDIRSEIDNMIRGGGWVDWNDGTTA
mmetsp:Transcript_73298/g.203306  ORF Transcript_73298/g.203306 Transcript_73298/m.203306 type:complete len:377 (-) Transcript_73298:278-1408(-)